MSPRRFLARALSVCVLVALRIGNAAEARPSITVGEISANGSSADAPTLDLFRSLVEREIARLELDRATKPLHYVFSASLVRLDARATHDGTNAICVVSATLRHENNGAIIAAMQGTGSVAGDRSALPGTRARALEVAVHGAVRHLPEAL
ncbi:MAG TPA: hypothetical protein VHC69_11730 [Polyangiaceae bacterium]|nr:hypothetical protein [Polyangiaceae bacterium]